MHPFQILSTLFRSLEPKYRRNMRCSNELATLSKFYFRDFFGLVRLLAGLELGPIRERPRSLAYVWRRKAVIPSETGMMMAISGAIVRRRRVITMGSKIDRRMSIAQHLEVAS
jgi:hypothetical protein